MKKLLILLMAFGLFAAACGDDDSTDTTPGDDAPSDDEDMADGPTELNVAYFLQWPTANQVSQLDGTYDAELGVTVNWIPWRGKG